MKKINTDDVSRLDRIIGTADRITVIVHMHPDGDAAGSGTAITEYLTRRGKDAVLVLPDPFPASLDFLMKEIDERIIIYERDGKKAEERILSSDLIVCQDFNDFSRTGAVEECLRKSVSPKILIDHHLNPDISSFDLVFSDVEVSSTAELLYWILLRMPDIGNDADRLPALSAEALMTGMTTDTNNFANSVFPSTLEMASALLAAGVDRDRILDNVFNSFKESRIRLMGYLLDRCLKITGDGVAYMILTRDIIARFGIQDGDTEGFVNIPLSVKNVRMSIFLKEDKDRFRVSIRSKKGISANRCAREFFNGGGHELASGGKLMIPDDVANAVDAAIYTEKVTHMFLEK